MIVNDTMYLAGQIGLDPKTGTVVSGGTVAETEQVGHKKVTPSKYKIKLLIQITKFKEQHLVTLYQLVKFGCYVYHSVQTERMHFESNCHIF